MKRKTTLEKLQYKYKELEYHVNQLQMVIDYTNNQIEELREHGKHYIARYIDSGMRSAINKRDRNISRMYELDREIKSLSSLFQ
jgi:phage shock protein A|tara:strand:+ start:1273 stop:1524 length:252 start_codon:yes stop_codon:yes gene_type:complete